MAFEGQNRKIAISFLTPPTPSKQILLTIYHTRGEVSVNTRYFIEHLIFPRESIKHFLYKSLDRFTKGAPRRSGRRKKNNSNNSPIRFGHTKNHK